MSKNKTIYVDGLALVDGHFSGVGQYILGILKGMDELIDDQIVRKQEPTRVRVIIPYNTTPHFTKHGFKNIEYIRYPLPFRIMAGLWRRHLILPLDLFYWNGVFMFPNFVYTPLLFSKSFLTIYDISFELYRQYSDEGNARFLSAAVRKSIEKTNKIITISKNAKKELLNFYKLPDEHVKIATPATDPRLLYRRSKKEIEYVKQKYEIQGNYILALSNLEPRKNLSTLVDAYCALPKELRDQYALLLVGVNGWKMDTLFDTIIEKVTQGFNIIRPSHYVSDEDKAAILSGAAMLVYPSHYEGFGMPPLEALACGTPVITADNSSLPEVVKGAGIMLKSTDTKGYTKAMTDYLKDSKAAQAAITEGPARAREFSWKESAQVYFDTAKELS
jgi:glycosyltransferase involved in cell wall biosynthesis